MKNSFVAFFDVLGFKNLVEKNSHEELIEIYEDKLYNTLNLSENIFNPILKFFTPEVEKDTLNIKTYLISDSIILIQNDLTKRGFLNMIAKCQLLLSHSFADGIPLRGALSFGPVTIIENVRGTTIVGLGLTKAYDLERTQQWSGGMIDYECFNLFPDENADAFIKKLLSNKENPLIIKYDIPLKNSLYNGYSFNWTQYNLIRDEKDIIEAFTKHKKEIISSKEELMIDNTLKYYRHSKTILK